SGLLGSYLFDAAAQPGFVVVIDGSDDAQPRKQDIGRVQASAEAYFHDGGMDSAMAKNDERHRGDRFEIRWMRFELATGYQRLGRAVHCFEGRREGFRRDRNAADLDALGGMHQVG